jgi:hypothetical protein
MLDVNVKELRVGEAGGVSGGFRKFMVPPNELCMPSSPRLYPVGFGAGICMTDVCV